MVVQLVLSELGNSHGSTSRLETLKITKKWPLPGLGMEFQKSCFLIKTHISIVLSHENMKNVNFSDLGVLEPKLGFQGFTAKI